MKFLLFALLIVMLGSFTIVNVYADSITISTNKVVLTQPFEKFLIEGNVVSSSPVREVNIKIFDSSGNLVFSPTVGLDSNGEFVNVARVDSSWTRNGLYTIEVSNEKLGLTTATQVEVRVSGNAAAPTPVFSKIQVSGVTVEHNVGVSFENVQVDTESKKVIFNLASQSSNQLTLKLPQQLITNPQTVIVDGTTVSNFQISKYSGGNTLTIPITSNSKQVEIIGTSVIPEFGSIATIILGIAITTVVLVIRKSFKVNPTFFNS